MCPNRPVPPPIVSDEPFEPIVYKLFTNFRMAGITPEQIALPQRRRYSVFLDVCDSFPVAAAMEMPLLSTTDITSCTLNGDDGDNQLSPATVSYLTDAARLLYDLKKENLLSEGFKYDLAKDWSNIACAAELNCKSDELGVKVFASGDGLGELPTCSNKVAKNSDTKQDSQRNGHGEVANGFFAVAKLADDDELAGAVGGQLDEFDK